jgi:hypothetical protein
MEAVFLREFYLGFLLVQSKPSWAVGVMVAAKRMRVSRRWVVFGLGWGLCFALFVLFFIIFLS